MPKATVAVKVSVNQRLEQRCARIAELSQQIAELDAKKKNLSEKVLADYGDGYESDGWKITPVKATSASRISKELLVKLGVSAKLIAKATIPGTPYAFPKITNKALNAEKALEKAAARTGDDE